MRRMTGKTAGAALSTLARLAFAILLLFPFLILPAKAQQRVERRSLLEIIFGRRQQDPGIIERGEPQVERSVPRPKKRTTAAVRTQPATPPDDKPTAAQKLDSAKTILVVGDFFANGLGSGLEDAFSTSPGVAIQSRTTVASGLVRPDYYDWPAKLPQMMDSLKPAAVVIMIGANDRQQLTAPGLNEKFGTDIWMLAYEERVQSFAKLVTAQHIPLFWVGLPPFGSDSAVADIIRLNQLYKSQIASVGGEFVDIWDGFTDEDGKFIVTGSDINGQQVRLRTSDGINMTDAGRRKLAFYVEKPLRRLLGEQASPDIVRLDTGTPPDTPATRPGDARDSEVTTVPISLSDPNLDGGTALLGTMPLSASGNPSPRDLLVEKGEVAAAPAGRVDNFQLSAPTAEKPKYNGPH